MLGGGVKIKAMKKLKIILAVSLLLNVVAFALLIKEQYGGRGLVAICKNKNADPLSGLSKYDMEFIDEVVGIYDSFVRANTAPCLSIGEAYRAFFDERWPDHKRNPSLFEPSYDRILTFLNYFICDLKANSFVRPWYIRGSWRFRVKDDAFGFIDKVAKQNPFWNRAAESLRQTLDFTSTLSHAYMYDYKDINFDSKAERFLVALHVWSPGRGPDNAFVIKVGLPESDSLRKALNEKIKQ